MNGLHCGSCNKCITFNDCPPYMYMLIVHPVARRMQRGVEQYCHVTSSISCAIIGASLSEPHLVETIISLSVYTFKIEKHLKNEGCCCKKEQIQEK